MGQAKRQKTTPSVEVRTFDTMGKPDADLSVLVVQIGRKGDLDAENAATAAKAILNARETFPAAAIVLTVDGYDNDARELWDVPEVRDYILLLLDEVFSEWPNGGVDDLNLNNASLIMVLVCIGAMRVVGRDPETGNYLVSPIG